MRLIWLADFDVGDHQGGAQQTNKVMIEAGRERGHEIEFKHCHKFECSDDDRLIITNNITRLPPGQLDKIINNKPYIRYEHDYWPLQNPSWVKELYGRSLLNIFLSPLHRQQFKSVCPKDENVHLQHSPVSGFRLGNLSRNSNMVLCVGQFHPNKGQDVVVEYARRHQDKRFVFYGWGDQGMIKQVQNEPNCEFNGSVKNETMYRLYSKAESLIHLPRWKEPFGRIIMEAYLSGCHIIHNDNVGALSYDWDWSDYDAIKAQNDKATDMFWDKIESVL